MTDVATILTNVGKQVVADIQSNLTSSGTTATGKSSKSLKFVVKEEGKKTTLTVTAKPYFLVVETGRKPTPGKRPSREMIENLGEWLRARGKDEGAAWAIAVKINKEGTNLYKKHGRKDIVSNVINEEFVFKVKQMVLDEFSRQYMDTIKSVFNIRKAA